ncbi:hypothetical protein J4E82_011705 [Alternaria postmessia]|uniref:uncharacterized protein n=1 Tax=Alternaria postmessia TaxID=1187938 RepID=UPI0022251A47|nr:uncharacterized protein J4E82_011705 [Alternaria postmessia]KAI5362590.1 hypothetical protein J4E82_011705 [Alternaria postmessia]
MSKCDSSTTASDVVAAYPEHVAGKTFVITGASTGGLGATVALALASAGPSKILLLGRTESKISPVIQEISKISPTTRANFVQVDLESFSSVRTAAASVAVLAPKIDVLINNAGIMGTKLARTPEGLESQFATNHIGHFLLTNLLVPQLEKAGESWPVVMKLFEQKKMEMPKEKTLEEGAATSVAAALDPRLDSVSGAFLDDCQVAEALEFASSEKNAEQLWALSEQIVGERFTY